VAERRKRLEKAAAVAAHSHEKRARDYGAVIRARLGLRQAR